MRIKNELIKILNKLTAGISHDITYGGIRISKMGGLGLRDRLFNHESKEELFLGELNLTGKTIYDIGAYEGKFTVFFSKKAGNIGKVVAFEPNPENIKKIHNNIRLNIVKNVKIVPKGIADRKFNEKMLFRNNCAASGSIEENIKHEILFEGDFQEIIIEIDSLDNIMDSEKLPAPDFIKIDVEGMEYSVLKGMGNIMGKYKPDLFIEIHGVDIKDKTENIRRVTSLLIDSSYMIKHIESDISVNKDNCDSAKDGHIYCNAIK